MKTKISSRALRVTLIALVLGMILAVTSFAALSIEDGKLVGKDAGTYTAQQVTSIKNIGNALVYNATKVTLDGTENLTAGLWKVTCPDNTSVILYSEGAFADRSALGKIASGTKLAVSGSVNQFVVGCWTTPKNGNNSNAKNQVLFNIAENNYGLRANSANAHLGAGSGYNELGKLYTAQTNYKSNPSEANKTALLAAQTTVINKFNSTYYAMYGYEPAEMMPANELVSFTYKMGFFSSNTGFAYTGDDVYTKAVVYLTDKNGTISKQSFTVKREDGFLKNNSKDNKQSVTIDFTVADDDGNKLPADKFIVGLEIHPYVGMEKGKTEPGIATAKSASTHWSTIFYPDPAGYEIFVKPVDISKLVYADGTVTIPKDNYGSVYQFAKVNGIDSDGEGLAYDTFANMTLSGDNYVKSDLTAGLWAFIGKSNTDDLADSDPALIYVAGSPNDRKRLGDYSSGNLLKVTTKINEFIPGTWTGPDGNAKSSTASWSAMWDTADGDYTIRPSSQYSHFSGATQYYSRNDGAIVDLYNAQTAYNTDSSATNKEALLAAQAAIVDRLNTRYYAVYSYTADEIIPANEVLGFTYRVGIFGKNTGLDYTGDDLKSKAVLYTTDKNGNITKHTWTIALDSFLEAKEGASMTIGFDFTQADDNGKTLTADEYVVAMELHPFTGMQKGNTTVGLVKATAAETSWSTKLVLDPEGYDIYVEKIALPEITVDGDTITITSDSVSADYVYAKVNGITADGTKLSIADYADFTANENVYTASGLAAGLWSVKAVSNDVRYADSDPVLVYIEGDSFVRKELGTIAAGTNLAVSTAKVFTSGRWTGPEDNLWNYSDGDYSLRPTNSSLHLKKALLQSIVDAKAAYETALASGDEAAIASAKTTLLNLNTSAVNRIKNSLYIQYAYTPDEFVPTDEFLNFTYKLSIFGDNNNFYYVGDDIKTKIIVYVTDKNGNIKEYTWTQSKGDDFLGYGKPALTSQSTTFDFTVADDNGNTFGENEYVVAMRVYPYTGMEKAATDVNAVMARVVSGSYPNWTLKFFADPAGYGIKVRAVAPELKSFPALVEGGNGEISGLDAEAIYEFRVKGESDWANVPTGTTHFAVAPGTYEIRVKEEGAFLASDIVEITVESKIGEFISVKDEVRTFYLASDFVEVKADYEIEVGSKGWISSLALDNIKTVAPESNVIITGEGYKLEITASDIDTDKAVHYYNLLITFNGESRHDTDCEKYKELAGDEYVTNYYVESVDGLPFANGTISIYLGEQFNGLTVQLKKYNNIAGRLTREESTTVSDGWVKFTLIDEPGVITCDEM